MTCSSAPTIVGNTHVFYLTGKNPNGEPEDITDDSITFRAFDLAGVEIVKTEADMSLYAQSGVTLGQAAIPIAPGDWPAEWIAIPYGSIKEISLATERVLSDGTVAETQHGIWRIKGQAIV